MTTLDETGQHEDPVWLRALQLVEAITPENFHHFREVGNLHDWCESVRSGIRAYLSTTSAGVTEEQTPRALDEARALVVEANNSLFGSQAYFHSLNGGPFDKYHLSRAIEDLKERIRRASTTPVVVEEQAAAWRWRSEIFRDWQVTDTDPVNQFEMEATTGLNMSGLEVQPLYPVGPSRVTPVSQKEAEPVAWRVRERPGCDWAFIRYDPDRVPSLAAYEKQPLYASPAPGVEPVGIKAAERLLRPIVGIENRTAQEVFDIMSDRVRLAPVNEMEPVNG